MIKPRQGLYCGKKQLTATVASPTQNCKECVTPITCSAKERSKKLEQDEQLNCNGGVSSHRIGGDNINLLWQDAFSFIFSRVLTLSASSCWSTWRMMPVAAGL
ncbi:unnamed protein product, partial [Ectocarpus sp. 4 AP-2014]